METARIAYKGFLPMKAYHPNQASNHGGVTLERRDVLFRPLELVVTG